MLSRMLWRGSKSLSQAEIKGKLELLGNQLSMKVGREVTTYCLPVEKGKVKEALNLLSEVILNPALDAASLEAEKPVFYKDRNVDDPETLALDSAHYCAYRDSYFGHPENGIRDNIYSLSQEMLANYHGQLYVGSNIVVSGAGSLSSAEFEEMVAESGFGKVKAEVVGTVQNSEKPHYTPSLMFQRDDEIANTAVSSAFLAPSWNHSDFFAMEHFMRLIGDYRVDKSGAAFLNASFLQNNSYHSILAQLPGVLMHKPHYIPYSDTGLFVNFLFGNEMYNHEMIFSSQYQMSEFSCHVHISEAFRARNQYWNDLLNQNCPLAVAAANAKEIVYLNRIISRTERAKRISAMQPTYLEKVAEKWFWDKEISVSAYGPLHNFISSAHYNRHFRRSTLGKYSIMTTLPNPQ